MFILVNILYFLFFIFIFILTLPFLFAFWEVGMLQDELTDELLTVALTVESFDAFLCELMLLVVSVLAEYWERSRNGMVQSRS